MTQLQRILFEQGQDIDVRHAKQPQDETGAQATAQVKEARPSEDHSAVMAEAETYLQLLSNELGNSSFYFKRLDEVSAEIVATGTYRHTYEELAYGAKVAWRNNKRCIGRLPWKSLHVIDKRSLSTAEEIFEAAVEHIRYSTNNGRIRPTITIFAAQSLGKPGIRIWNPQLIRYAGYRQLDGSVIGDPMNVELTEVVKKLGWKFEARTHFDILPLVIQIPGQCPKLFELPRDAILEVPIIHPDYSWFAELGLKWHALPAISNMCLEIGGISYTAAPFSGWYLGTEIGARNLSDVDRYNLLPVIAQAMGLDTHSDRTLWKDRALIELNAAVLYSFAKHKVTMVDHHLVSRQFFMHIDRELKSGRPTPAEWSWIVPPVSSSTTLVFHRSYKNITPKPNFLYQPDPWKAFEETHGCPMH